MTSERFKTCVACYLLLINNKDILMLKRSDINHIDNGKYTLVSGHINGNESVIDAMIREAKEEIDIDLKHEDLKFVGVFHRLQNFKCTEYIDFYFYANRWDGTIINNEPHKHSEVRWFDINSLPYKTVSYVEYFIRNFSHNSIFFDVYGWNET